jgi:copper(I)-binding protein
VIWSSRPRRLTVLAVAALIPVLAGCEAGNNAPIFQWHPPTAGAAATVGNIAIRNVFILGAPVGAQLNAGESAGLFFAVINNGSPDRLVSVSAPGAASSVTLPGGTVRLADNQAVLLTGPAPKAILNQLTRPLSGAASVHVVMTFQNAGSVTLVVPVIPMAQYYSTFSPAPSPSPSVKNRKRGPGASPSAGTSSSPGASPSPSATSS